MNDSPVGCQSREAARTRTDVRPAPMLKNRKRDRLSRFRFLWYPGTYFFSEKSFSPSVRSTGMEKVKPWLSLSGPAER